MINIKLHKKNEQIEFCSSKWFGNPDMPSYMNYPEYGDIDGNMRPYNFLCQIRLEEITSFDKNGLLPKRGMLYFFAKLDYFLGRIEVSDKALGQHIWDNEDIVVIYIEDINLMECCEHVIEIDGSEFAIKERAIEFCEQSREAMPCHQLLGRPYMMPYEDWDAPCEGWQLLLQVDSDEDDDFELRFMDMGLLYFLIECQSLSKCDFTNVRAMIIST